MVRGAQRLFQGITHFQGLKRERKLNGWKPTAVDKGKRMQGGIGQVGGKGGRGLARKCLPCSYWGGAHVPLAGHVCPFCKLCWSVNKDSLDGVVPTGLCVGGHVK